MPVLERSAYQPPWWQPGGHWQTIVPNAFRHVPLVTRQRERLELADGDFLDLAWAGRDGARLAILSHGLENRLAANYMQGMARALATRGWDVLAWTMRGCGPDRNRLPVAYHGGRTDDLRAVLDHALTSHPAERVAMVGFSLGGNLTLKLLGEPGPALPGRLRAATAISVPCDLAGCARRLAEPDNRIYMRRFLRKLRRRIRDAARRHPGVIDASGLDEIRDFESFDARYTAPLHGFASVADYWEQSSCRRQLAGIRHPVLLLNARNDPFLTPSCHPFEEAAASRHLVFECSDEGGHVGFGLAATLRETWAERRAADFLDQALA